MKQKAWISVCSILSKRRLQGSAAGRTAHLKTLRVGAVLWKRRLPESAAGRTAQLRTLCVGAVLLAVGCLAGCASTPESSVVRQKGVGSLENYEEGETLPAVEEVNGSGAEEESGAEGNGTGGSSADGENAEGSGGSGSGTSAQSALRTALGAPESWQSEVSDTTGKIRIVTDAVVEIPDAEKVSSFSVTQHTFDQSAIDLITEVFFPDATFYTMESYTQMTKADYLAKIETLKGYIAEGNLDPYGWGLDGDGSYTYDIYGSLEAAEARYEEAPETRELVEVHPQYGLTVDYGGGDTYTYDDSFYGVAVTAEGTEYKYILKTYDSMPMEVEINKIRSFADPDVGAYWIEYKGLKAAMQGIPEEEEVEAAVGITLEDALALADEKVALLGLDGMEMTSWEYTLCYPDTDRTKESWLDTGYLLHYTRVLNGIPVTYTNSIGGAYEDMDSVAETWSYETLDITVTKDGIEAVMFLDEYDIGEVKTENLNLLSFDEIMDIYEKMMVIQNADIINYENSRTYNIERITFGYTRIYEPTVDGRTGLLVPVWDFFGSFESQYESDGEDYDSVSATQYRSYLTINAVDGSVIDRDLGY